MLMWKPYCVCLRWKCFVVALRIFVNTKETDIVPSLYLARKFSILLNVK